MGDIRQRSEIIVPTRNKVSKTDLGSACSAYSRANRSRCRQDTVLIAMNEDLTKIRQVSFQLVLPNLAAFCKFGWNNICCQLGLLLSGFLHLDEVPC